MDIAKKKNMLMFALGALAIVALGIGIYMRLHPKVEEVHYHAGFQVYVDSQVQNFSDLKYMQMKPCGGIFDSEDDQIEKAHLHDNVGDVVHVHRKGAVWGDLFKNLKWEIPKDKEFVGYLNGERKENLLEYPILPYDSVLFFSGKIDGMNQKLQARVTDDHMKEVEAKLENCGKKE